LASFSYGAHIDELRRERKPKMGYFEWGVILLLGCIVFLIDRLEAIATRKAETRDAVKSGLAGIREDTSTQADRLRHEKRRERVEEMRRQKKSGVRARYQGQGDTKGTSDSDGKEVMPRKN